MGEYAEMLLDGSCDEWTGEYIGPAVGYPRSLDPDHYSNQQNKRQSSIRYNKAGLPSKASAANGVYQWLRNQPLTGAGKNTAYETRENRVIAKYGREVLHSDQGTRKIADIISKEHWVSFIKWVKENYK
jgi:hypothetical protein